MLHVSKGDERAFEQLYIRHHQHLASYIFELAGSKEQAEESVQEIFIKVWHQREELAEIKNFKAWLFRISKNHTLNVLRKAVRDRIRLNEWQRLQVTPGATDVSEEQYKQALLAIEQLPPQQQKAFMLRQISRLRYEEIALRMQISRETVKSYLKLANSSISKFVNGHGSMFLWVLAAANIFEKFKFSIPPFRE